MTLAGDARPRAPSAFVTTNVSHLVIGRAYVDFHGSGAASGLPRVSKTCHSSSEENDVISLFSFAFGYFCSAPFGLSRASNLARIEENNEKAFGADEKGRQFSGCKSGVE